MTNDTEDSEGIGGKVWLGFTVALIGAALAALVIFLFLGFVWASAGFFSAFLIFAAVALGFGYIHDKREAERRKGLPTG